MAFKVEADNLRRQASLWTDRRGDVGEVKGTISVGFGQGSSFGFMAGGAGVKAMYDEWTSDVENCLIDAAYSFDYLARALVSTANDYDGTDATSATRSSVLDKLIDERRYHHD